ncbi:TetR/AcrR family transcriptional regulator [Hydrogenophaga sp. 5NK40-0174]|uniref:TetR/AcrR family transcriptional regulator n=1 Tax=Hydrogenophaga sp. 5NK40-0174 TaxID=3127649 RepID=UPI003109AE0E
MPAPVRPSRPSTRDFIVEQADRLFYERGYEHTSFADISATVGISRGNFYHHFKTKDDILEAVIDRRMAGTKAMLHDWSESASPRNRILSFIQMLSNNQVDIARYGCPVGSLCTELGKLEHPGALMANRVFELFVDWLALQFRQYGLTPAKARRLAMQLMGRSQGIAVMASTLKDTAFIRSEVRELTHWLDLQCPNATKGITASQTAERNTRKEGIA